MKTWKIIYWHNGEKKVAKVEAITKYAARVVFFLHHSADDIISIEEVTDHV